MTDAEDELGDWSLQDRAGETTEKFEGVGTMKSKMREQCPLCPKSA